jgi:hypothetical protein
LTASNYRLIAFFTNNKQQHCPRALPIHTFKISQEANDIQIYLCITMLARSRFETETPNVIDAGDSAPSRPSRRSDPSDRGVASETGTTGRISFPEDSRQYTASNKGHIAKGVRINYSIEADEEPDACSPFDDDHTNEVTTATPSHVSLSTAASHHDELQIRGTAAARIHHKSFSQRSSFNARDNARSIQEARLFAAHMLNESERRSNLHSEHTLSMKQESSSTLRHLMQKATGHSSRRFYDEISLVEEPTEIDMLRPRDSTTRLRKTMVCRMLAALVAIVVVVCFVVLATDAVVVQSDKGSSTLLSENGRLDSIVAFLFEQEVSSAKDLYDESTPQYRAARWMALEDPERLSVPEPVGGSMDGGGGLRNTNPLRFVQRYVLAVLFFGLDGENWENRRKFVTGVHECSWFESHVNRDGETYAMGVTCDHNMQVRNLLLRKFTVMAAIFHLHRLFLTIFFGNTYSIQWSRRYDSSGDPAPTQTRFSRPAAECLDWDSANRAQSADALEFFGLEQQSNHRHHSALAR